MTVRADYLVQQQSMSDHRYQTDLHLDGVEFCVLPSGLHTVDRDVMYVLLYPLNNFFS